MASKGDLIIDSADTEPGGCLTSLKEQAVYIVNSNYNLEQDIDNFEEVDLPPVTSDTKDDLLAPDSHVAAKKFESQYKHQHQTYSSSKKLWTF